ncbi:MAG: hypothetical protein JNL74_01530, partial [Fibrobacteres bacterium]|nr:hypothetical protein [Fibrobacterota bacterium]
MENSTLKKDRLRFSLATVLAQSEEGGIGAVTTVIIRSLGGDALHLGFYGATGSINLFFSWVGTLLLRVFKSYRKAMICAMVIAMALAALIAATILLPSSVPAFKPFALWSFVILMILFSALGGPIVNIESSWIGELVPKERLGWFTSYKVILAVAGGLVFSFLFARLSDVYPRPSTYAGIYLCFMASFLIAIFLYKGITD